MPGLTLPLTVLIGCGFAFSAPNRVERDWALHPAVVQVDTTADIYAIGDIHSDYQRMVTLLAGGKILTGIPVSPAKPVWAAGKSVVVFTGDLIDKGPDALDVIAFLRALREAAAHAGGRVIVLMGNHEAEFLAEPDAEKTQEFATELKAAGLAGHDVAACHGDVGQFLCELPFAVRVNDWFFSHAGNTGGRNLDRLQRDIENGLAHNGFATAELVGANSLLEARVGDRSPTGKSWFEAGAPRMGVDELLAAYAKALGVHHIVEGHHRADVRFPDGAVRKPGEMFQWHGRLFFIDTGLSRGVNDSAGAILHIQSGKHPEASAICGDGTVTPLWSGSAPRQTGKAAPCAAKN